MVIQIKDTLQIKGNSSLPYQGAAGSCTGHAWYQQEATLHYEDHD